MLSVTAVVVPWGAPTTVETPFELTFVPRFWLLPLLPVIDNEPVGEIWLAPSTASGQPSPSLSVSKRSSIPSPS